MHAAEEPESKDITLPWWLDLCDPILAVALFVLYLWFCCVVHLHDPLQNPIVTLWGLVAVGTVLGAVVVCIGKQGAMGQPIHRRFTKSWGNGWRTPKLAEGDYCLTLEYAIKSAGRLTEPLKLTLLDQKHKPVSIDVGEPGPRAGNKNWEEVAAGWFHAVGGRYYTITIDDVQRKALAGNNHRLKIELTPTERMKKTMEALDG